MIWEVAITASFIILSALTVYFFLAKSGFFKKKRKRSFVPRKRKKGFFLGFRKGRSKSKVKAKRIVRKKGKKKNTGKTKRKSGIINLRKMPFILDPNNIKSYTSKYLAGKKIKATWEKVLLVGVDS